MNLKESEVQFIETELDALDLNAKPINKKRHFSKALQHFKKYLMDTFSITTNGYYTNMGIGLGASFGALFGIWFSDIFTTMRVLVAENSNDLFFGLHIPTTILIILFAVLMGVFSKAIYRKDFKTIYGGIINKLDLALAEMEELKG